MKIWAVTLVGMASVFVPSALWGQNQSLTGQLQQLFDCAEQNNASLIRMRAAIATAEAGEETARLAQLPDVEAQLSISYLGDARLWNRTFGESMAAPMPHISVGRKVRMTADAVPGVVFWGTVERISDATGSAFSLIPQDNATGNFVKVEQRIPVRIRFKSRQNIQRLRAGMNMECTIL